ncbi:MAG: hypothetical protein JSU87_11505 [Gemmatimonadota bacterium]|nr:MAG: hypothetical protein JSU87_11505 [Gemmatimonadota bacterium]
MNGRPFPTLLLVAALGFSTGACGGDELINPADLAGSYALLEVNGGQLPAVIASDVESVTRVVSGALTLEEDRDYLIAISLRTSFGDDIELPGSFDDRGIYILRDRSLFFASTSADTTWVGSVDGSTVAVALALEGGEPTLQLRFVR